MDDLHHDVAALAPSLTAEGRSHLLRAILEQPSFGPTNRPSVAVDVVSLVIP